jgi:hypothetical protein
MTTALFFEKIQQIGVDATLQQLAEQNPMFQQQKRQLERLKIDVEKGLVLLSDAYLERNRISMSILELHFQGANSLEDHQKLSEILREYLCISEEKESASKALSDAEFATITAQRKLHHQEMPELDLSPMPPEQVLPIQAVIKLIGANQLELAFRHALTLSSDTGFYKNIRELALQYKAFSEHVKRQLVSYETSIIEENRISNALIELLNKIAKSPPGKEKSFWQRLWS